MTEIIKESKTKELYTADKPYQNVETPKTKVTNIGNIRANSTA